MHGRHAISPSCWALVSSPSIAATGKSVNRRVARHASGDDAAVDTAQSRPIEPRSPIACHVVVTSENSAKRANTSRTRHEQSHTERCAEHKHEMNTGVNTTTFSTKRLYKCPPDVDELQNSRQLDRCSQNSEYRADYASDVADSTIIWVFQGCAAFPRADAPPPLSMLQRTAAILLSAASSRLNTATTQKYYSLLQQVGVIADMQVEDAVYAGSIVFNIDCQHIKEDDIVEWFI